VILSCLAAMAENRVIGRAGRLPWHLPADMKRFKSLTMGHTVIAGRRTYESIGRPLPGRRIIVLSRDGSFTAPGVLIAASLDEAIEQASRAGETEAFAIGGEAVYESAIPRTRRLYLTLVRAVVEGDVFFPVDDFSAWRLVERTEHPADAKNAFAMSFLVYERE